MAEGKTPTRRKTITLAETTVDYLAALAKLGTHGSNINAVARTLIEEGVRQAIRENFLRLNDDNS